MKLFEEIKFNYNVKVFAEDLKNLNLDNLKTNLKKLAKNPPLYLKIYEKFFKEINDMSNSFNLLPNNLIFINSFFPEDISIIKNFISYYLKKINHTQFDEIKYEELMYQINILFKGPSSSMTFNDIVTNSVIYQSLFGFINQEKDFYVENIHSFFSTTKNYNFTNPYLTKCYFMIVDEPFQIYRDIKASNNFDKNLAQNIMFNLDSAPLLDNTSNIEITRNSWPIHTASWTDPNVINSLKGLVLSKNLLLQKDLNSYVSIILHLKQANIKIDLNYDIIQQYLNEVRFDNQINKIDISNNEKKFIEKNIQNYELNLPE